MISSTNYATNTSICQENNGDRTILSPLFSSVSSLDPFDFHNFRSDNSFGLIVDVSINNSTNRFMSFIRHLL